MQVECDVLNVADAIGGYEAMDFGLIDADLAQGMKSVLLEGEEHILRKAAQELVQICGEIGKAEI